MIFSIILFPSMRHDKIPHEVNDAKVNAITQYGQRNRRIPEREAVEQKTMTYIYVDIDTYNAVEKKTMT